MFNFKNTNYASPFYIVLFFILFAFFIDTILSNIVNFITPQD